jgi:hypothetical protein
MRCPRNFGLKLFGFVFMVCGFNVVRRQEIKGKYGIINYGEHRDFIGLAIFLFGLWVFVKSKKAK